MRTNPTPKPKRLLSQDLTRWLILTVSAIFIITSAINYWINAAESKTRYVQKTDEYLAYLQENLKLPLWNVDREWIDSICQSVSKYEGVALLVVAGEDDRPLYTMTDPDERDLIVRKGVVRYRDHRIGHVEVGFTKRLYTKHNYQILYRSILQMLLVVAGLLLVTRSILSRIVETPLHHLLTRIDEIAAGEYRRKNLAFDHIEMTTILDRFNDMASKVMKREQSLIETNQRLKSEITERKEAEKALNESERRYRQLVEELPVGVFRSSPAPDGHFLMTNPALIKMFGYTASNELEHRSVADIYDEPDMRRHLLEMIFNEGAIQGLEVKFRKQDGTKLVGLISAHGVLDKAGQPLFIEGIIEDVTDRKNLERQIRQTQKMEAIGTLAGGIAHDFNNILSSIFGFTEVVKMRHSRGKAIFDALDEILNAGLRARSLIKQINAFSRQTDGRRQRITLDAIIKETVKFLRASLPATIEIRYRVVTPDCTVIANPTQVHQILMNLCTNSAHALGTGGNLEVTLDTLQLAHRGEVAGESLMPGDYVRLNVTDTGHGISQEHIDRIFEPFFTTKERGEGTGMGLAVVHGIVNNMNGTISVESQPGEGTRFEVLIPMVEGQPDEPLALPAIAHTREAKILFVDDEEGFILSGLEILNDFGYEVVTATRGKDALSLMASYGNDFDLVITDLVMPQMTGLELAKRIHATHPTLPIILCTGFSAALKSTDKEPAGIRHILMKPLLASELIQAIELVLQPNGM